MGSMKNSVLIIFGFLKYHQVSYIKSSDKYLIGCFVFVFFTLMEYCFVLLLKARQKNHKASETFKEKTVRCIAN